MAEIPKPDSPEVAAAVSRDREIMIANAERIFAAIRTEADCFLYVQSAIDEIQRTLAAVASRNTMTSHEIHNVQLATAIATGILQAMQHNPLYDTSALVGQLVHHFTRVVKSATVQRVVPVKQEQPQP